ncbi:hypothetical protein SLE2022_138170 [Rubroshorea leprosula]
MPSQNSVPKKVSEDIELLDTQTLVKEVEKVFESSHLDPLELEKAKKKLKVRLLIHAPNVILETVYYC